ncbi:MAG: SOS response-associated peptidase [Ferruginibacter sp.]|nr:SOS response-associated peptidase [Ferruginibacter sp.]
MCYFYKQEQTSDTLKSYFNTTIVDGDYIQSVRYVGFAHPQAPIILNSNPKIIQPLEWGLIPFWAKDKKIQQNTLNARIETLHEKPSFKGVIKNRCLVIADGFFEWQWLDKEGKKKQPYILTLQNNIPFAFAGLYSHWTDKNTGEIISTFTIITTQATGIMAEIHNSKKRMPVILTKGNEDYWLDGAEIQYFSSINADIQPHKL